MDNTSPWKRYAVLLAGDMLALALVTVVGFATHGTAGTAGLRMLTTFVPLVLAWLLVAPHLGAFDLARLSAPRQLWRPVWAMLLAGPLAAWLRGVALGTAILPVFVPILSGVSALGLLVWRGLYCWISLRKR